MTFVNKIYLYDFLLNYNSVDIHIEVRSGTVGLNVGFSEVSNAVCGRLYNLKPVLLSRKKFTVFIEFNVGKVCKLASGISAFYGEFARIEYFERAVS